MFGDAIKETYINGYIIAYIDQYGWVNETFRYQGGLSD